MVRSFHAAYGLRMACSFALPGMPAAAPADAGTWSQLALELCAPDALERAWSGASAPPLWRGRQGDGRDLTLERGSGGDLLFSYGELARFRLDASMRRLDCAPSTTGLEWQRVLLGKVLPSVGVLLGNETLHAAAVRAPDGAVAIMAPSGAGKSTLALELMRRGWPLLADDALALTRGQDGVRAHAGTPHMNVDERAGGGVLGEVLGVLGGELWMAVDAYESGSAAVSALCLLERGAGLEPEIEELPANPLTLAPYMFALSREGAREHSRFCVYAELVSRARLVRLRAGLEHSPARLADLLEGCLRREPALAAGAAR
jgi:hypothetical protein